jgi:hypothetical protein
VKLYRNGLHFAATQTEAKAHRRANGGDFELIDVGHEGREQLATFLNDLVRDAQEHGGTSVVLAANAAPAVIERDDDELHPPYASPWSAREILADMDVGKIVKTIRQVDGKRLGDILGAATTRLEALRQEAARKGILDAAVG